MERPGAIKLSEEEFVNRILNADSEIVFSPTKSSALSIGDGSDEDVQMKPSESTARDKDVELVNSDEDDGVKKPKIKRRSNLTEFNESQTTKRKNESAKRELTSIVTQLGKIDKQLNCKDDEPRASINFIATFNSFKSNRISTFKYPPDAEIKRKLLDYDDTISAVRVAVKEAMKEFVPRKDADVTVTSSTEAPGVFITPTKTISTFSVLPSPVTVRKSLPTSSKNLCAKNSCTFGKKIRKPVWVQCSYGTEGESCNYWVHAPCIGFPSLKDEDVHLLGGWCCPDHTETHMMKRK